MADQPFNPQALATYRITANTSGAGFALVKAAKGRDKQVRLLNRSANGVRFEFQDPNDGAKPVAIAPVANGAPGSVWLPGGLNFTELATMGAAETSIDVLADTGSPDLEVTLVDGY